MTGSLAEDAVVAGLTFEIRSKECLRQEQVMTEHNFRVLACARICWVSLTDLSPFWLVRSGCGIVPTERYSSFLLHPFYYTPEASREECFTRSVSGTGVDAGSSLGKLGAGSRAAIGDLESRWSYLEKMS